MSPQKWINGVNAIGIVSKPGRYGGTFAHSDIADDHYFVVTGLLVPSKESVNKAYKQFKKKVNTIKLKPKVKEKIFNEFKSTILDKEFQRIKIKMLEEIMKIDNKIIFSCYIKK